jgi:nanoRNase/pAp phosphatase (c-di-AMP/oligoRNAs hydrolase)
MNTKKLDKLKTVLKQHRSLMIVVQDYPDPDAIASAAALRALAHKYNKISCRIISGGFIGRSENRALLNYLDLPYHSTTKWSDDYTGVIAMVDTQPETGNNILPQGTLPDIVIDHHPIKRVTWKTRFHDIRSNYGATATIMYEYLMASSISINQPLATGLLYGIRSDTLDLGRESSKADIDAVVGLYPLANKRMLAEISQSEVSREFLSELSLGLANTRVHGKAVVSNIGRTRIPDAVSETADVILRLEGISWALCSAISGRQFFFSIRCSDPEGDAGQVAQVISNDLGTGGGHRSMAAGQIDTYKLSKDEIEELHTRIRKRFIKHLKQPTRGLRLNSNLK